MFAWEERALSFTADYCWYLYILVFCMLRMHAYQAHIIVYVGKDMFSSSFFSLKKFMLFVRSVRIGFSLVCSALFFSSSFIREQIWKIYIRHRFSGQRSPSHLFGIVSYSFFYSSCDGLRFIDAYVNLYIYHTHS